MTSVRMAMVTEPIFTKASTLIGLMLRAGIGIHVGDGLSFDNRCVQL